MGISEHIIKAGVKLWEFKLPTLHLQHQQFTLLMVNNTIIACGGENFKLKGNKIIVYIRKKKINKLILLRRITFKFKQFLNLF